MNQRIAMKRANLVAAAVLSIPTVLDHARASFWRLDYGTRRHYAVSIAHAELRVPRRRLRTVVRWSSVTRLLVGRR